MGNYLIIGGSSGIGHALAKRLAEQHRVFATYHKTVLSSENTLSYHPVNVLDDRIDLSFLPDHLDGLAYCPGTINLKPFHRLSPNSFLEDYRLQVLGAIRVLQDALPYLKQAAQASVVFFSTVAVQTGFPMHSQVAASKGALEGLTRALAAELAPKIRVNAIAPSLTDTPLAEKLLRSPEIKEANAQRHPLKRIGTPEDLAGLAAFLLSPDAGWITGQIFAADGGISAIRA